MLGKKLINSGPISSGANTFASENFNTVLYTGTGAAQRIGGYINKGAIFNGSSSYITIPIDKLTNTFSFSVWLYLDNLSTSYRWVFGNWNSTAQDLYVMIRDTGKIEVNPDGNNGTVEFGSSGAFTTNTWHHLAVSMDAGTYTVYLDGSSLGSGSTTNTTFDNGYNYQIGKTPNSSINEWSGKMDQFRLFDKAISSSEVTTLYGETFASTTISTTDIFNDNSGVALYQLDGNALDTGGVSGKFGSGAIFTGGNASTGSKISISNDVYGSSTSVFSASIWVNSNTNSGEIPLIGNGGTIGGTTGYAVYLNNGELTLTFRTNPNQNFYYTNTSLYQQGWKHIVLTVNDGAYVLYLDGTSVLNGTTTNWSSNPTPTYDTFIGNRWNRNESGVFDGIVDEIRIYSDVLTSTEVGYLYNNTTASIPTDNLQAYYKLNGDARDEQQLYDGAARNVTYAYDGTASNVTYQEATKFTPDLVWIKNRDDNRWHNLSDSVRGASKSIFPNDSYQEVDDSGGQRDLSFQNNGFTLEGNSGDVNASSNDYVAWCWKAGGTAVSNTDGSITSTVSANQDAGFSIVSYTGNNGSSATIGHGLNSAPELIITKARNLAAGWPTMIKTSSISLYGLRLNSSGANDAANGPGFYNNTAPTASVYSVGGSDETNDGYNYVSYCFHSVDGYQKIGYYTGNGSANGELIETGFEPAFVMIKRTNSTANWRIVDNKRSTSNPRNKELYPNLSNLEGTWTALDFYSNGFKNLSSDTSYNASGGTYLYLAIAADPDTTTPTVENSFDVVTYDGRSTFGTVDVETDFKPDLVWIKCRGTGHNNYIVDSIRGADKVLSSNLTASDPAFTPDEFTSFNENGFTVNFASGGGRTAYSSDGPYVAWCWKAGDHDDNLPEINDNGTIDSTVSVNDAAGFSISKFTIPSSGSSVTVGHGLSSAPQIIIVKTLDKTGSWFVYTETTGAGKEAYLELSNAWGTDLNRWANTSPTSTVFTLGSSWLSATYSGEAIAYCWTSVTGYSKIGSYTGTGAAGNAQSLGFAPRFLMVKRYIGAVSNWVIFDTQRVGKQLLADLSNAEASDTRVTLTSTGFEFTGGAFNESSTSWIYMAFK